MKNFFQSDVWRDLNRLVFQRSIFEISLLGTKYWGVIRKKKIPLLGDVSWAQVLGVEWGGSEKHDFSSLDQKDIVCRLKDDVREGLKNQGINMFFQLGICESLVEGEINAVGADASMIRQQRQGIIGLMKECGWKFGFRENMPLSTLITPLEGDEASLLSLMHPMHRRNLKKAHKGGLTFAFANRSQWDEFYHIWQGVAELKGMGIMGKEMFGDMMRYLNDGQRGGLFVVVKDGRVVSGSVVVVFGDILVYLYGATDRSDTTHGAHVMVQHEIMKWGQGQGFLFFDHFGGSPSGYDDHHLVGVSQFKERFGGVKKEYRGNFDLVINPCWYYLWKMYR